MEVAAARCARCRARARDPARRVATVSRAPDGGRTDADVRSAAGRFVPRPHTDPAGWLAGRTSNRLGRNEMARSRRGTKLPLGKSDHSRHHPLLHLRVTES